MTRVAWVEVVMGEKLARRVSERAPRVVDETCVKRFSPGFYTLSVGLDIRVVKFYQSYFFY